MGIFNGIYYKARAEQTRGHMRYTIHLYALPFQLPSWYPTLQFAATFLAHSNSAINPVIYAGLNENFKRGEWTITYMVWNMLPLIARFMGPTWSPSGADRTQVGPMLAHELCYLGHVLKLRWMILHIFHYFQCIQSKFVSCSPIEMEMSFWRNLEIVCRESCQIPVQPVSKFNQYHISILVSVLCLPSSVPCNTGPCYNDSIVIIRIIAAYCSNYDEIGWLRSTAVTIIESLDWSIKPKCFNTMTFEQIGMNVPEELFKIWSLLEANFIFRFKFHWSFLLWSNWQWNRIGKYRLGAELTARPTSKSSLTPYDITVETDAEIEVRVASPVTRQSEHTTRQSRGAWLDCWVTGDANLTEIEVSITILSCCHNAI